MTWTKDPPTEEGWRNGAARRRHQRYEYLRKHRRDYYDRCAATASALAFNADLDVSQAAKIEDALVGMCVDLLKEYARIPEPSDEE